VREVVQWLVPPPGRSGYPSVKGSPVSFRLESSELADVMVMGSFSSGRGFVRVGIDEFARPFKAGDSGSTPQWLELLIGKSH
jgi:hypothetical protein